MNVSENAQSRKMLKEDLSHDHCENISSTGSKISTEVNLETRETVFLYRKPPKNNLGRKKFQFFSNFLTSVSPIVSKNLNRSLMLAKRFLFAENQGRSLGLKKSGILPEKPKRGPLGFSTFASIKKFGLVRDSKLSVLRKSALASRPSDS